MEKYQNYPSIKNIKEKCENINFSFTSFSLQDIEKQLNKLDSKKVPRYTYKNNTLSYVKNGVNLTNFLSNLKLADITSLYENDLQNKKYN